MVQAQPNQPYVRMIQNPIGQPYQMYQGIPQIPYHYQQIQTKSFQPLQDYLQARK